MLVKNHVQSVRHFQRAAQSFQIPFRLIAHRTILGAANTGFDAVVIALIGEHRQHILRLVQNAAHNRLAQCHFRGDVVVEQFVRHVALVVEIAYRRGRQAQHRYIREQRQQCFHARAPHFCTTAVKFVQNDVIRLNFFHLILAHQHEFGIGEETNILRFPAVR